MSTAEQANDSLCLVANKVRHLTSRAQKLKEGDPATKTLAHQVAMTLTIGYQHPNSPSSPAIPLPQALPQSSPPGTSLTPPPPSPSPSPPPAPVLRKHNLFVPGSSNVTNKCKAPTPEPKVETAEPPAPAPKKHRMMQSMHEVGRAPPPHQSMLPRATRRSRSRAPQKKVSSKEFVAEDDNEQVLDVKVTDAKQNETETATSVEPAAGELAKSLETEPDGSTAEEDDSDDGESTVRLFGVQCKRCIKDDVTCAIILGKKQGEVHKCCQHCDKKKMKKTKVSSPSPKSQPKACTGTRSVSWKHLSSPPKTCDEDAEGEDDPELAADAFPAQVADRTPANDEVERMEAETPVEKPPTPSAIIDNDVNMDLAIADTVAEPHALPMAIRHELLDLPAPQPTALDIFQSIEALGKKFDALLQTSGDHAKALHDQMESWVTAMDKHWAKKFASMEEKIWDMEMKSAGNTMSISHMANTIKFFNRTRKITAFDPPAGSSLGNPYGQIPSSWLPQVSDASHAGDPSISTIGRQLATAWDDSRARAVSAPRTTSVLAIQKSGDAPRLSQGSKLSSVPSGSPSAHE
ncbi:hypothetical protein BDR05DRAFT_952344 [Suillus weaverae]|nr:hypothetical protein BDR05DRAFT_952344 [Suillus weaverae]